MYVLSEVGLCDPKLGLEWIITICGYSALLTGLVAYSILFRLY